MMLHRIKKSSSTLKATPFEILRQLREQVNLYPKNNKVVRAMDQSFLDEEESKKTEVNLYPKNNKVVRVMDQSFLDEEESKKTEELLDQISLRPFELTDVDDIMLWAKDKRISLYCGGQWGRYGSKKEALQNLKDHIIPHPWFKAICLKNRPIGKIFVHQYKDDKPCVAELGYVVAPEHWGKGIATTTVKMVLNSVFKECPRLERLQAIVDVKNLGSLRVVEKSGFLKEGVLRKYDLHKGKTVDMAMFSFLKTDFKLG